MNMTTEYLKAKNKEGSPKDDYHSMSELYFNRMVLTLVIALQNSDKCYKSKRHSGDLPMYDDMFIVVFETPEGDYSYHYPIEYYDLFTIEERPESYYDGHKPEDIGRLLSLVSDVEESDTDGIAHPKLLTNEEMKSHMAAIKAAKPKSLTNPNQFCEESLDGEYDL